MRAMLLAAGLGERMRPLSELLAKPVLPVLGRPLAHWTLDRLRAAGVTDVVVNTHHLPETVRAALGDGRRLGLRLRYSHEPEILGTGGGPRRARALLGDEPVLVVNGDVLFGFDLRRLVEGHRRSGALVTLALRPNPDPRRYPPVVTDAAGRILSIRGGPRPGRGTAWLFAGVHVLAPRLYERLAEGPSDVIEALYLPLLAEGALLRGVRPRGAWYDLGRPAPYLRAQLTLLRRGWQGLPSPLVAPGARVQRGARVRASVLGAGSVVGPAALVQGSLLWAGARVGAGARVSGSILASGARVAPGERVSRRLRAVVGGQDVDVPLEEP